MKLTAQISLILNVNGHANQEGFIHWFVWRNKQYCVNELLSSILFSVLCTLECNPEILKDETTLHSIINNIAWKFCSIIFIPWSLNHSMVITTSKDWMCDLWGACGDLCKYVLKLFAEINNSDSLECKLI